MSEPHSIGSPAPLARPGPAGGRSLHARGVALLALFALLPSLLLLGLLLSSYLGGAKVRVGNALSSVADALALGSSGLLERHLTAIELAARLPWETLDTDTAERRLRQLSQRNPELRTLLAADPDGRIVSLQRESESVEALRSRIGASVADREYFRVAWFERRPYLSDVFIGRGLWSEPVVALSAPILGSGGEPIGVLQATLNLDVIQRRLGALVDRQRLGLLLDRSGQVVFASAELGLKPGVASEAALRDALASLPGSEEPGTVDIGEVRYFAMAEPTEFGWTAVALLPERALEGALAQGLRLALPVLLLSVLGVWMAAHYGGAWLTRPVLQLSRGIRRLQPGQSVEAGEALAQPLPRELQPIASEVAALWRREREAFAQLDAALREREHEIERRTSALRRAVAALRDESRTDSLTGVGNYRAYRQSIEECWQRIAGTREAMAVLQVDIDHFKQYNDSYGHPAGDLCLRRVADLLQTVARECGAQLARSGGEEFSMVVAGCPIERFIAIARELLARVEALDLPHARSAAGRVTLSAGLAWGWWQPGTGPEDIVSAADRALYVAKNAGRNRLELAPGPIWQLLPDAVDVPVADR
ncbi:MAG: diguanylate cyclase domain-containing protein [Aquimonas sp.]